MHNGRFTGGLTVAVLLCVVAMMTVIITLVRTPTGDEPATTGPYRVSRFAGTPGLAGPQGQTPQTVVALALTATAAAGGGSPLAPIPTVPAATVTAIAGKVASASSGIALPILGNATATATATGASAAAITGVSPTGAAPPATATATPPPPTPTPPPTATPTPILDAAQLYAQVSPAVVMISNAAQRQPQSHAAGIASGTIFDAQGDIVTVGEVVLGSAQGTLVQQVDVLFPNGKQVTGKVMGRDSLTDLAVIKIDPTAVPAAISFGDSSMATVGNPVIAIGAPLQFAATITRGTISGLNRSVSGRSGLIQSSISVSSGLYGGPLIDANGNVIGVVTYNLHDDNATYKVAFAVPSNTLKPVVAALAQSGKVSRPDLGATFETLTPTRAVALGLGLPTGAYVSAVVKGGPADTAGLAPGDVITTVNNTTLTNATPLGDVIATFMPKQSITLTVNRSGTVKQFTVTLGDTGAQ